MQGLVYVLQSDTFGAHCKVGFAADKLNVEKRRKAAGNPHEGFVIYHTRDASLGFEQYFHRRFKRHFSAFLTKREEFYNISGEAAKDLVEDWFIRWVRSGKRRARRRRNGRSD